MLKITSIGYEGASPEAFIETLVANRVTTIVDVRAIAISRRKGFSKNALKNALAEHGIGYVHIQRLGDPKEGRTAARAGYMAEFRRIFEAHLATADAQAGMLSLVALAAKGPVCLLCFEADHQGCHRTLILTDLAKRIPLSVTHLRVAHGGAAVSGAGGSARQSRAAA